MLGELESNGRIVVGDLEAGIGTLLGLQPGQADVVLIVANPSAKSIEVARRAVRIAAVREAEIIVIANRVANDEDLEVIRDALEGHELVVVPEDAAIAQADREGIAPIDVDRDAAGVRALLKLAERLAKKAEAARNGAGAGAH